MGSSPSGSMQALVWEAPHVMAMRSAAQPTPQPDEVLIKVAYSGICGSELSGYLGHNALRVPPLVMGHEFSGVVSGIGEQVQAANPALKLGQSVTVNPMIYCGHCEYCAQGANQLCVNRRLIGAHRPGSFAQYVCAPAHMVLPLPPRRQLARWSAGRAPGLRRASGVLGRRGGPEADSCPHGPKGAWHNWSRPLFKVMRL